MINQPEGQIPSPVPWQPSKSYGQDAGRTGGDQLAAGTQRAAPPAQGKSAMLHTWWGPFSSPSSLCLKKQGNWSFEKTELALLLEKQMSILAQNVWTVPRKMKLSTWVGDGRTRQMRSLLEYSLQYTVFPSLDEDKTSSKDPICAWYDHYSTVVSFVDMWLRLLCYHARCERHVLFSSCLWLKKVNFFNNHSLMIKTLDFKALDCNHL